MSECPVEAQENVIAIGDLSLKRQLYLREHCQHQHLVYDPREHVVECSDCGREVAHWDALMALVSHMTAFASWASARSAEIEALEKRHNVGLLRVTKEIDRIWRSRMAPCCPHCHVPILPEDGLGGSSSNAGMERERRRFLKGEGGGR